MRTEAADKTLWQEEAWDLCRETGKVSGAQKVRWRVEQGPWALRGTTLWSSRFIHTVSLYAKSDRTTVQSRHNEILLHWGKLMSGEQEWMLTDHLMNDCTCPPKR